MKRFSKSFTEQPTLPAASLDAANRVLTSARLHRYQAEDEGTFEVAQLEAEFAAWQGAKYCLAVASGGQAMQLALRAVGVHHDEPVLTNAFTLAPVPGAIRAVGATPVLVDTTPDLVIDLEDLKTKIEQNGARVLVLSHMRGHLVDMDALRQLAQAYYLTVIEDCAHTMGATWNGIKSGNFGRIACFSTQTYKHMNSGEGGFITSDDPEVMARATVLSGSYMNYDRHEAAPPLRYFADAKFDCPNMSARMDALRAAILRPQLETLDRDIKKWMDLGWALENALSQDTTFELPARPDKAKRVASSIQFRIPHFDQQKCRTFCETALQRGVEIKWFGNEKPERYTSTHQHWRYLDGSKLPNTDLILATLFDMRLPLTFSENDCHDLVAIISEVANSVDAEDAA